MSTIETGNDKYTALPPYINIDSKDNITDSNLLSKVLDCCIYTSKYNLFGNKKNKKINN